MESQSSEDLLRSDTEQRGDSDTRTGSHPEEEREQLEIDCPICLGPMSDDDRRHPLQCATLQCEYNFCSGCIRNFISSSQDGFKEASDGSLQVKVHLKCPNCRSDLSTSIRDTLLLRRARKVLLLEEADETSTASKPTRDDSMRRALENFIVRDAVEEAQHWEEQFFRESQGATESDSDDDESIEAFGEHWGVEADVENGVHSSFHFPQPFCVKDEAEQDDRLGRVDKTLLGGLDYFLSTRQQGHVTNLMTSGDPNKLAEAAEILRQVASIMRERQGSDIKRLGSVYDLVQQAEKARNYNRVKELFPLQPENKRTMERKMRQEVAYLNTHPLPVRMPKCVRISLAEKQPLGIEFCDDTWDGKVKDAFCKLTIGFDGKVTKKEPQHRGVRNILGSCGSLRVAMEKPRVLVSSVRGEAGKLGVMRGDVVTHLNGVLFEGDAQAFMDQICSLTSSSPRCGGDGEDTVVQLCLNAERSVAEALKRRAMLD